MSFVIYPIIQLVAWALVIGMLFPKAFSYYGKFLQWIFRIVVKSLEVLIAIVAKILKLIGHILERVFELLGSLFGRR